MKRKILIAVLPYLLICSAVSWSAETVGSQSYTYIGTCDFDFDGLLSDPMTRLADVSFSQKNYLSVTTIGGVDIFDVIAKGSYGGVLIWIGHGNTGAVLVESFPYTTSGKEDAIDRIAMLVDSGWFDASDLALMENKRGTYCWGVGLTGSGIGRYFSGDNGLACIFSCYSSSTGQWNSRIRLGYSGLVLNTDAQADAIALFTKLTANNGSDFSAMKVSQADDNLGFTPSGNGDTALFPWVTSYQPNPSYSWDGGINRVTVNFGVDMTQTDKPFYVGGYGVVRGDNRWLSATCAVVDIYSGWAYGDIFAGLDGENSIIKSSKGIPLLSGLDFYLTYYSAVNSYPPAASVAAFLPVKKADGVGISAELDLWKGSRVFWVSRDDGKLVGDTLLVKNWPGNRFQVFDPGGNEPHRYRLYEQEHDGQVFVRAEESVLSKAPEVIAYPPDNYDHGAVAAELQIWQNLDMEAEQTNPLVGLIIVPDAWQVSAQALANWHTAHGRTVSVVGLSAAGNTRELIKAYIETAYANGERYVLLGAGAHDEWYDQESHWPDLAGEDDWHWWYHYYHEDLGYVSTPSRNLIPTWYYPDTEYDNRSYWTPYYVSDIGYAENCPGLRLGRFPAYSLAEFQVLVSKTIHYLENADSWSFAHNVSLWAYCHDSDGNVGYTVEVLADEISQLIPPDFVQYRQNDYTLSYAEREAWAVSDWSAGRVYLFMFGTSSTMHKPIHFFKKDLGWQVSKLAANQYFPIVLGTSCGIGGFDMFLHPTLGTCVAQDLMTADPNRGTCVFVAPSRGTYMESNRQLRKALVKHLMQEPAQDIGTAFLLASQDVAVFDSSYCLYGDPMCMLPGQSPTTAIGGKIEYRTALVQNYPNPFNPVTTIAYTLGSHGQVSLKVYNVAGQLVETLLDEIQTPGSYKVFWDGRHKASGVYFYCLRAESFSQTKKMVLLK